MACCVVLCCAGKTTTIRALADLLPQVPVVAKDPFNSGVVERASATGLTSGVVLGEMVQSLRDRAAGWTCSKSEQD